MPQLLKKLFQLHFIVHNIIEHCTLIVMKINLFLPSLFFLTWHQQLCDFRLFSFCASVSCLYNEIVESNLQQSLAVLILFLFSRYIEDNLRKKLLVTINLVKNETRDFVNLKFCFKNLRQPILICVCITYNPSNIFFK